MLGSCGLLYLLFSVSELQDWNSTRNETSMDLIAVEQKHLVVDAKDSEVDTENAGQGP